MRRSKTDYLRPEKANCGPEDLIDTTRERTYNSETLVEVIESAGVMACLSKGCQRSLAPRISRLAFM